ncbi:TetR/AcrR family transcriptional regulator [Bacillus salacetis]|uniref:TetR/AcrR family transcriptional regulator n=1 Tax=Bacillus salacetis TaxID=2315464 RepID=UPI003BA0CB2E
MPKLTFFNLPEDKRDNLVQAAKKEFSRVPLSEALISNIIKEAKISRGSFYQYFEDKEDAYFYLLDEYAKDNKEKMIGFLKETDGDIFTTFIRMFDAMLIKISDQENRDFFKNTFLNMNHRIENSFSTTFKQDKIQNKIRELSSLINIEKLNVSDEDEIPHVIEILRVITFHNLIKNFKLNLTAEESRKNYMTEIELLKRGLYKG